MTREEAIDWLARLKSNTVNHTLDMPLWWNEPLAEALDMAIKALEQEPRKGKWISKPHVYGVTYCSECNFELKINDTNYCPNCGAKMVEPQERSGEE